MGKKITTSRKKARSIAFGKWPWCSICHCPVESVAYQVNSDATRVRVSVTCHRSIQEDIVPIEAFRALGASVDWGWAFESPSSDLSDDGESVSLDDINFEEIPYDERR